MNDTDHIPIRQAEDREDLENPQITIYELRSAPNAKKVRIDLFVTISVENASRSKVQQLIDAGGVTVNGKVVTKSGQLVLPGDFIVCTIPRPPSPEVVAEPIPLDIVYEDDSILIVNKPAGMVTHPAYGHYTGTLVNALMYHTQHLSLVRGEHRAGILHRLDKGTSGLLAVAKTEQAHRFIAKQFADHSIEREYQAIIWGSFKNNSGEVDLPLARHRSDRKRMSVVEGGKHAVTHYTVLRDFDSLSLISLRLQTGRTHQIRVHMSHLKHALFGDPTYGGRRIHYGSVSPAYKRFINEMLKLLPRQALHARTLGFIHPESMEFVSFESSLPSDILSGLNMMEEYYMSELT